MEIPLYVQGEEDGHFDQDDYIQFLGHDARNRYTRWNVYWLSVELERGKRIVEIDATPADPTAKSVPSFRSRIYFEDPKMYLEETKTPGSHPLKVGFGQGSETVVISTRCT